MIEHLWEIARALHSVQPADKQSFDTLVGCTALIISMATQLEQRAIEEEKKQEGE